MLIHLNTCSNEAIIQSVALVQRSHGLVSSELLHETYARKDLSPVQSIDSFKTLFDFSNSTTSGDREVLHQWWGSKRSLGVTRELHGNKPRSRFGTLASNLWPGKVWRPSWRIETRKNRRYYTRRRKTTSKIFLTTFHHAGSNVVKYTLNGSIDFKN